MLQIRKPNLCLSKLVFVLLWLVAALFVVSASPALAQQVRGSTENVVNYDIRVTLNPDDKTLSGTERITYLNNSSDDLNELWFRLYLNAFRSADTQWMLEAGPEHRGFAPGEPGWIRIESMTLASGEALAVPAADYADTVFRLPLTAPVVAGGKLELDVKWTAQLPRVFARTGFSDDFFMAGQWYPKLAAYNNGEWDSEPWRANAEFFANFGDYLLEIDVPSNYVVGASGVRMAEQEQAGRRLHSFAADRVTDVAWTAWPGFQRHTVAVNVAGEQREIEFLLPAAELPALDRHVYAASSALDLYSQWYGVYPWPKLTVVVPPAGAGGAAGMEYPTLVTTGDSVTTGAPTVDSGLRMLEMVTVHEIAHEWFPMQVQSNEAAEAWLDEGFAEYMTIRVLGEMFGPGNSVLEVGPLRLGYEAQQRISVAGTRVADSPLTLPAWQYGDFNSYAGAVYAKGSLTLLTLQNLYGDEAFTAALRAYADEWRFRHPITSDLQASLEKALDADLTGFFDQFVDGHATIDFAITEINSKRAVVERSGDGIVPVEILVEYSDGSSATQVWDASSPQLELNAKGKFIAAVKVDPRQLLALEVDRLDNYRTVAPDNSAASSISARVLWFFQMLLQFLGQIG